MEFITMTRSNEKTLESRIKIVVKMLLKGSSRLDIVQFSSEKWKIGERQADKYILKAKRIVKESVNRDITYDYSLAVMRFTELFKAAITKKDLRTALTAAKELASLQSLYNNSEILNLDTELLDALTPSGIQKRIFELPFNQFLNKPENFELKEKYNSFRFTEAFLKATKGQDVPEL